MATPLCRSVWLLVVVASCLRAEAVRAAERPSRRTSAAPGDIDTARSRAYVRIGATGLGHEHGAEGRISHGNLRLDAERDCGAIEFDMSSFSAESLESREYVGLEGEVDAATAQQVTANMLGADVLNAAKYPTAVFEVDSALPLPRTKAGDPEVYQLDGRFTLHGVTRLMSLKARADRTDGVVRLRTKFAILQTQFGIKPYKKLLGAVGVADRLEIWGDVWVRDQ